MDNKSSIFKIDKPITNKEFFTKTIILFIFQIAILPVNYLVWLVLHEISLISVSIFSAIGIIIFAYLHFINCTKRIWNLLNINKNTAIMITLLIMAILCICKYKFLYFLIGLYFIFILVPAKNKNYNDKDIGG